MNCLECKFPDCPSAGRKDLKISGCTHYTTTEATERTTPSGQAELLGCATELAKIADELQGLAVHIREYIAGDMPTLPILWDIEEVVINYKKVTRPE